MSFDWKVPTYSDGDAEFNRLLAIGTEEANEFLAWLKRNPGETLSPFARRALAHTFGHVIDRLALPATSVSEPVAEHIRHRHEALELAKSLNGADFAGDLEPPPGDTVEVVARSLAIVAAAYDWTVSPEGYIIGLVAGDMGYAATSMKVDAETLAAIYPAPSESVARYSVDGHANRVAHIECRACNGSGFMGSGDRTKECRACHGTGRAAHPVIREPTGHCAKCGRDWGDVGVERCDECPTTDAPSEPVSDLVKRLRKSAAEFERPPSIQSMENIRAIDAMNEAADALEHRSLAVGWRSIETAPHDWTDVLVFDAGFPSSHRHVGEAYFSVDVERWFSPTSGIALKPTHWMPLPQPPEAK